MPNENFDKLAQEFREKLEVFKKNADMDEFKEKFLKAAGSIIKSKRDQIYWMIFCYVCIFVVLLLLVFFGYKLYKSLAERERKKEEKKRQKQQKKKK